MSRPYQHYRFIKTSGNFGPGESRNADYYVPPNNPYIPQNQPGYQSTDEGIGRYNPNTGVRGTTQNYAPAGSMHRTNALANGDENPWGRMAGRDLSVEEQGRIIDRRLRTQQGVGIGVPLPARVRPEHISEADWEWVQDMPKGLQLRHYPDPVAAPAAPRPAAPRPAAPRPAAPRPAAPRPDITLY